MLQVGIVGLPNVGKSTLFNALLRRQQALVANYPFATIEPNVGIVPVPDERLAKIAEITKEEDKLATTPPLVPATIQFVDIAGLVRGAASGAGLGNKFLSHIREVDIICLVVRAFPDEDIIREGSVDPKSDAETILTELMLADLQTLEKTDVKKATPVKASAVRKLTEALGAGKLAKDTQLTDEEREAARELQLLTHKTIIFVLNLNTTANWTEVMDFVNMYAKSRAEGGLSGGIVTVDAKLEADLAALNPDEQLEYLQSLGIQTSGLDTLIQVAYDELNLISFLTAGEKEVRAWTTKRGSTAPQAAGVIHTDFEKAFIKAEVVSYPDFVNNGGRKKSRELGKVRFEGREYVMQDGDIVEFKTSA